MEDPACAAAHSEVPSADAIAHGAASAQVDGRTLVAVFSSPVARSLMHFARDTGFRTVLVEPAPDRVTESDRRLADQVVADADPALLHPDADVVVTDHHRPELGPVLRDVLVGTPRWIGVMGSPRHQGPHVEALAALGVPAADIDRVHRPIGLNIGSRTPPEIALSALAGLLADRNDRPGGFDFPRPTDPVGPDLRQRIGPAG
jgi:xanthine/CO dehydrogenase XdhC/CoxF family maturation factor